MALCEPRPKKCCKLKAAPSLPLIPGDAYRFRGDFNGFSVVIQDENEMKKLVSMGYFGKATLSRSYPQFQGENCEIIRKRVFENRKRWGNGAPRKVIIVPDSDSDDESCDNYLTNFKPQFEFDRSGNKENVNLGLEEAFFLASAVNCLDIYSDGVLLELEQIWNLFRECDGYFVQNYVAYYHFRAKNWVIKPGIKFGGDFLLYKQGPPFYHASYVVIIIVVDENSEKIVDLNKRSTKVIDMIGLNRLCETAGKELLICEISWPNSIQKSTVTYKDLQKFSVKETIMKRWIPSQENKQTSSKEN